MLSTIQARDDSHDAEILNPAGWLRTVAARRIADHFRAVARVQHLLQQAPQPQSDHGLADPARQHELEETRAEVRRAMDALPDQYRLALEWKYLDKLSVREIAERWGMSEKGVESILFRARREFRERLHDPSQVPSRSSQGIPRLSEPIPDETAQEADAVNKSM
jgi:RNA polymerase sigma factor (sigma-70 family)